MKLPFVLLIINFVICNFGYSQAPSKDELERVWWGEDLHYEVTIAPYSNKIKLQEEGLLISIWDRKKSKWEIKFIKRKRLNKLLEFRGFEIERLFFHIKDEKIMEMSDMVEPEFREVIYTDDLGNEITDTIPFGAEHKSYIVIQINDLVKRKSLYLKYGLYDERIDKLIDMVNDLIPKKYKGKYAVKKEWIVGTPKE